MQATAPTWLGAIMRAGFGARAAVYAITGVLATLAAWRGGGADGTKGALAQLADDSWGAVALGVIGVGLFAYALWRVLDSILDLESYGTDAKGFVARVSMLVTAAVHTGLGIYCLSLLAGGRQGGSGGGDRATSVTRQIMEADGGRYVVGAIGIAVIGAGVYYWIKAIKAKYRREIRRTEATEKLDWVMKAGLIAHGVVIAIIGGFFVYAAWTFDPSKAGGVGQAFDAIRDAEYGRWLLLAVALGLIGFGVYCALKAIYGIVPRAASSDVQTLGGRSVGEITGRVRAAMR